MTKLPKQTSQNKTLPALADNAFLRYFSFSILYFAQGIPNGILLFALPAWLAMNGKTPMQIGSFIAVIMLPWSFKFIAAPVMDRFTYLPMGRRKPWLLLGQLGLVLGFILLALISNPLEHLNGMMAMGFLISFFGIIQDISIDSMAIDLLPENQEARANGLMQGSRIFGKALSVATFSYFINKFGYSEALLFFAFIILLIVVFPIILRERNGEKRLPWSKGKAAPESSALQLHSWKVMFKSLIQVFVLPVSILVAFASFFTSMSEGFMDAILPVFTVQELGWADTKYAQIFSNSTMISGVLALFVGGALIDFFGKKRMLIVYSFILIILVVSLLLLKNNWNQTWIITTFFISFYTFDVFSVVAIFAISMNIAWKRVAATQFTIYMAISNIGTSAGAWLMGALKSVFSWEYVLMAYIPITFLVIVTIGFMRIDQHKKRLLQLENTNHKE